MKVNYLDIIHKYIPPGHPAYRIYMVHVSLVTARALQIADRLDLKAEQRHFIEEAGMLHDIGIVRTTSPKIGCTGTKPYVCHITEGRLILEAEGLPRHARIAENHIGVGGLSAQEILESDMPLPPRDMLCETIEEKIVSYADLFFSKNPDRLFLQKSMKQVRAKAKRYGKRQERLFKEWSKQFDEED